MSTRDESGAAKPPRAKQSFEASLARLEAIVREMEGGELGLEQMIARFEEGQELLKFCGHKLNEVERRIEVLVKKGEDVVAEPFDEAERAPGGKPPVEAAPPHAEELF